jgi:serine/threonine protein kinase
MHTVPEPIPGYRLISKLGQGGCGQVWEAVRPDGCLVAVKYVDCRNQPPVLVSNEIRMLVKLRELRHPNMIRLLDVLALRSYIVLVMDKADGNLLELEEVYLQETGRHIPCDHLLDLIDQAATGLDFLAEQPRPGLSSGGHGMQHCDVKPSNLLLLQDTLKVADFGLCMASETGTHNKRFMGTPPYAAPELYDGKVTTHTDQYGLAVTYMELVSGRRVMFPREIACRPGACPIDFRKVRGSEIAVIQRAIDPNWMNRWPSCKAFVTALRQALSKPRNATRKYGSRQLQTMRAGK